MSLIKKMFILALPLLKVPRAKCIPLWRTSRGGPLLSPQLRLREAARVLPLSPTTSEAERGHSSPPSIAYNFSASFFSNILASWDSRISR
jgi:hypothetical protein